MSPSLAMFRPPRQQGCRRLATPEDQISGITAPVLIVHGRDDQVIPLENAYRFHQLIDNSQLHGHPLGYSVPLRITRSAPMISWGVWSRRATANTAVWLRRRTQMS